MSSSSSGPTDGGGNGTGAYQGTGVGQFTDAQLQSYITSAGLDGEAAASLINAAKGGAPGANGSAVQENQSQLMAGLNSWWATQQATASAGTAYSTLAAAQPGRDATILTGPEQSPVTSFAQAQAQAAATLPRGGKIVLGAPIGGGVLGQVPGGTVTLGGLSGLGLLGGIPKGRR